MYNNNPQLSPPKKSVIRKESEYQKQFRQYKLVPVPIEEADLQQRDLQPQKKVKVRGLVVIGFFSIKKQFLSTSFYQCPMRTLTFSSIKFSHQKFKICGNNLNRFY